jgi:hypothetical protein
MGTISRWMGPLPEPRWTPAGVGGAAALGAALLAGAYFSAGFRWVLLALAAWTALLNVGRGRTLRRLAAERPGEDIGTFARAFDRRAVDPRVIRGVWDALQAHEGRRARPVPLRPADRLEEDVDLFGSDVELLCEEVAERVGRAWQGLEANPYYGRVTTVGDLVQVLNAQPKRPAT